MRQYCIDAHYRGASGRFLVAMKEAVEIAGLKYFYLTDVWHLRDVIDVKQIQPSWRHIEVAVQDSPDSSNTQFLLITVAFLNPTCTTTLPDKPPPCLISATRTLDYNALRVITTLMLNDTTGRQGGKIIANVT